MNEYPEPGSEPPIALAVALRHATRWWTDINTRSISPSETFASIVNILKGDVPIAGRPDDQVIDGLAEAADGGLCVMNSPRFFGWVIGGVQPASLAADWLVSAWDQNACMAEATPAVAAIEAVTADWVKQLLRLPSQSAVSFVTGGQMANFTCLAAARGHVLRAFDWDVERDGLAGAPPFTVIVGEGRHHTIDRALRMLGIGTAAVVDVRADAQGRMLANALRETLRFIDGPVIVCAQAGQINTGAVDPLAEIADVVDEHRARLGDQGIWLHVDGAIGLWARTSDVLGPQFDGCERADSWSTDAHKWLNTPYDCGIAIVKNPVALANAMSMRADYLEEVSDARAPLDWTPELSRRARSVPVYAAIKAMGKSGIAELTERCSKLAASLAEQLAAIPGGRVMNDVNLNQVLFTMDGPSNDRIPGVVAALQREGVCYPTGTKWQGVNAIRFSVCNWQTTQLDIDMTAESVASVVRDSAQI